MKIAMKTEITRPCKACGITLKSLMMPEFCGIPAHWIDPPTYCNSCIDRHFEALETRRAQENLNAAFRVSMITERFRERTFENFKILEGKQTAYEKAKNLRAEDGDGLLLFGPCGVGKTHLAAAIAHKYLGKMPVVCISVPEFLAELRAGITHKNQPAKMAVAKSSKLLILDDIGAEKSSEWVQETLFLLINSRYENKLATVFTTNCSLDELGEKLGQRIVSRIIEMCRCVRIYGQDMRLAKAKKEAA